MASMKIFATLLAVCLILNLASKSLADVITETRETHVHETPGSENVHTQETQETHETHETVPAAAEEVVKTVHTEHHESS